MGMFDNVKCEAPLPDGFTAPCFQSKDFACEMDTYTITSAGRLMRRYVQDRVPTPESEWEYVGATDPLHQLWHESSKWRNIYAERDVNFHGWMRFYTDTGKHADGTFQWHEYKAKFTDGQLVEIVPVPYAE